MAAGRGSALGRLICAQEVLLQGSRAGMSGMAGQQLWVSKPRGDSQGSPQGTQAGPSSPAACPYRLQPRSVAAGQGSETGGEASVA